MENNIEFFHYNNGVINRKDFASDNVELQKYINETMSQHEERGVSRHYVGIDDSGHFVSMFCLLASTLKTNDLKKSPEKYPDGFELPTIKIGRLVVDKKYIGKRFGEKTLAKAIEIFISLSKNMGAIGLTVDAKKNTASFYKKYGFEELNIGKNTTSMILYTSLLKKKKPSLFEQPV